jgi:hypothetical protein
MVGEVIICCITHGGGEKVVYEGIARIEAIASNGL